MQEALPGNACDSCVNPLRTKYKYFGFALTKVILGCLVINGLVFAETQVVFTAAPNRTLAKAIFPSDVFTDPDPRTATGVRVNLGDDEKDCLTAGQAVCSNAELLNRLDGFSVNPRISVCFSGDIDPATLGGGISFVPAAKPGAAPIGITQIITDKTSHCVYAKPAQVLDQRTRYLLLIRNTITDGSNPVKRSSEFESCLASSQSYCASLRVALSNAALRPQTVVGASLFTTLDATGWLEDAYKYVNRTELGIVLPAGFPWQFPLKNLRSMTWNPDNAKLPPQALPITIPITALDGVASVAFGLYLSPNYINTSGPDIGSITNSANQPAAVQQLLGGLTFGYVPVSFHVFLPSKPAPPGGYPVVIYGHGLGDNQFGAPTYIASTLAKAGYATVAMEIQGHGYGSGGTVTVKDKFGLTYKMLTPGRGVPLKPGPMDNSDGCIAPGALAVRDCGRQTAVDLFALIKTIQRTNGLTVGLNPQAISYVGQSFGSIYGSLMHAVAPDVQAAVLNAGGGPFVDVARLAINGRLLGVQYLCGLGLLNVTTAADTCPAGHAAGVSAEKQKYFKDEFNDNYVYREDPVETDPQPGSLNIQAAFEAAEWLGMLGDALSFAPHFKKAPLPGVPAKSFLLQDSDGDLEVPNPTNAALNRAADGEGSTIRFKFLEALGPNPAYQALAGVMDPGIPYPFPILPHRILSNPTIFGTDFGSQLENAIALAEQNTVVDFLKTGAVNDSDVYLNVTGNPYLGRDIFEKTAVLPARLSFSPLQIQP